MNWLRKQLNEIIGLFCLSFAITPTDAMKEQLGIAPSAEANPPEQEQKKEQAKQTLLPRNHFIQIQQQARQRRIGR